MTVHRMTRRETEPSVGRDIEAWCGAAKCNRLQEHTIVAMVGLQIVQVRCKICGGTHKFKTVRDAAEAAPRQRAAESAPRSPTAPKTPKASTSAPSGPSKAEIAAANAAQVMWQRAMRERDVNRAQPYSAAVQVQSGDVVQHAGFGLGVVEGVLDGKAKILFSTGSRLLIVGR